MFFWDWENVESFIDKNYFKISNPGKLLAPIKKFRLKRDSDLQLCLETRSTPLEKFEHEDYPAGTVRENTDTVDLVSITGLNATASGVQILDTRIHNNYHHGTSETTQTCSIDRFKITTKETGNVEFIFEWIANIENRTYLWPDTARNKTITVPTRSFGNNENEVTFEAKSTEEGGGRSCMDITVCGHRVIIGITKTEEIDSSLKPGYILFFGNPEDSTREKIRDGISFILGFPIIYLGYSKFNSDQRLLSLLAISAYSMHGRAFQTHTLPPSPITTLNTQNVMDKEIIERKINAFCENYENYGISSLNWNYWHAVTAPAHMAPAYFGAIIESLQRKYVTAQGSRFNNCIIPKSEYREIKRAILKATEFTELLPRDKKTLIEKLESGNIASQKVRSQRFFEYLGLNMGSAELSAWQRRNDAAHGNDIPNKDYISLIKDTKLLKLMLHRIVLRVINASDTYIDYYSLNFPTRPITSGVTGAPHDADQT
jgi:hypothetical protein